MYQEIDITKIDEDIVCSYDVVEVLKKRTNSSSYPFCFLEKEPITVQNLIKNLMQNTDIDML